jgi:hypothetical protein
LINKYPIPSNQPTKLKTKRHKKALLPKQQGMMGFQRLLVKDDGDGFLKLGQ